MISACVNDSSLRLWDSSAGAPRGMLKGHQGDIIHMTLSTVRLWLDDLPTDTEALRSWMTAVAGTP